MKHYIRINGTVKEIDCELGSGILDIHDREIFEGDKVRFYRLGKADVGVVIFYDGCFFIKIGPYEYVLEEYIGELEIVDD